MKEYGMGDEDSIKEIINEVDTDNVSCCQFKHLKLKQDIMLYIVLMLLKPIGREDQLHGILRNDEKWNTTASQARLVSQ